MDGLMLMFVVPVLIVATALMAPNLHAAGKSIAILAALQVALLAWLVSPVLLGHTDVMAPVPGLYLDRIAAYFMLLTNVVLSACMAHAWPFFEKELSSPNPPQWQHIRQFYVMSALLLLTMTAVFICDNLGYLWISVEATTLLSAGLVYFSRTRNALEATWKYFIICSVGIAFGLLGTILIFASSQHAAGEGSLNVTELTRMAPSLNLQLFKLGFIFSFLGYGTKAGVFPLHSWLPDAHSEAPAPASAILSGSLLNCGLFAIWKLYQIAQATPYNRVTREFVIWAGTVTVIAASFFLVRQHGLKRLWAYSSIENVGLMLFAIGLGSGPLFFLQSLNHSLAKVSLFLLSGNIIQSSGRKQLREIRGMLTCAPLWGSLLALAALAATGAPPFGSFISEWMILSQGLDLNIVVPVGLVLSGLALSFIAVASHMLRILLGTPRPGVAPHSPVATSLVPAALIAISLVLGFTISPTMMSVVLK